jgi:transposase-like protein
MKHLLGQARKDARYADIKNEKRKEESGRYYRKARTVKNSGGARIQSQPIFCLYELCSRVYIVLRNAIKEQTLREIIRGEIVIENDKREDIGKMNEKLPHLDGIEGFWLFLREHLVKHHGVSKNNLIYYIKEKEFRFNQRHLRKKGFVEKLIAILLNPGY